MDHMSSPDSVASSNATVPTSASRQPTYTTAGTIYNPGSSQPLQPPTRRGRSYKWSAGGAHSELLLFPKSALAGLPLKIGIARSPSLPQYTPLQQNYDRAVSPFSDADHQVAKMSLQLSQSPRMRCENAPSSLIQEDNQTKSTDGLELESEDDGDDSDQNMETLMSMTVKSLHNLASYPNPNQKAARKALLRGVKPPKLALGGGLSSSGGLFSSPVSSAVTKQDHDSRLSRTLYSAHSDPPVFRRTQSDMRSGCDTDQSAKYEFPGFRSSSPTPIGEATGPQSTSSALASGPGAPRPLTAGPPGQRQYRPSTFESTFKALQPQLAQPTLTKEDEDAISITQHTLLQAGIDDITLPLDSISSPFPKTDSIGSHTRHLSPLGNMGCIMHGGISASSVSNNARTEFLLPAEACNYDGANVGPIWTTGESPFGQHNHSLTPALPNSSPWGRFKPGTDRLTDEAVAARNEKINQWWYAGSGMLNKIIGEVDFGNQRTEKSWGVIGDRRPDKGATGYHHITMDEANRMPVSEHVKPLLDLAFVTLLQNTEVEGSKPCVSESSCCRSPVRACWSSDRSSESRPGLFKNGQASCL